MDTASERMVNGADWVTLATDTAGSAETASDTRTVYHDTSEPQKARCADTAVAARSGSVTGEWSMTAYIPAMEAHAQHGPNHGRHDIRYEP